MARLQPIKIKTKSGIDAILRSPELGEGLIILETVRNILKTSPHVLTEPDEFTYTVEQENEIIGRHIDDPHKIMIVPYVSNTPVGMLNFGIGSKRRNSHVGSLGISLLENYRSQGIGGHMLNALVSWAESVSKIEKVELRVHSKNEHAIALYQKAGFQIEGREIRGVKLGPALYDDVVSMALFVK